MRTLATTIRHNEVLHLVEACNCRDGTSPSNVKTDQLNPGPTSCTPENGTRYGTGELPEYGQHSGFTHASRRGRRRMTSSEPPSPAPRNPVPPHVSFFPSLLPLPENAAHLSPSSA